MKIFKIANKYNVIFDPKDGIGSVPWNQEVNYRGFVKKMTPDEFRSLVPKGNWDITSIERIKDAIKNGKGIGNPFLEVQWLDDIKKWQVIDHEGRSRVDAMKEIGFNNIPVHIFPIRLRARDLTDEMKNAEFIPQK